MVAARPLVTAGIWGRLAHKASAFYIARNNEGKVEQAKKKPPEGGFRS
ncbi:hypothetical protein [Caballeronia telluris]|jgi:hypothetical protein|nr:hypothetical protein [Caballeronia telluris]